MLLCIKFSPFHPIIRPSVCLSVCTKLNVALHSALSFLICFCFFESSTGTRSFVLSYQDNAANRRSRPQYFKVTDLETCNMCV